ncbi:MAG: MarR family transcriptional regulator [Candidatus Izimaplasma sp.]|nr:MarR family transcriptional regulator [Candidatus Izimaplasma bacterium]
MNKEIIRQSLNKFLKMYYQSCKEVYEEISFERITSTQFKYLKNIHSNKEVTLTQLASNFDVSKPTMNEFIHKFLDAKIVKRRKSETDKRVSYISLTDIGITLATTNALESKRAVEKMLKKLDEKQIDKMVELFDKFGVEEL